MDARSLLGEYLKVTSHKLYVLYSPTTFSISTAFARFKKIQIYVILPIQAKKLIPRDPHFEKVNLTKAMKTFSWVENLCDKFNKEALRN